jgi:hypothetical protein
MRARDIDRMVISVLSDLYCVSRNVVTSFDLNPGRGAVFVLLVFMISIGPDAGNQKVWSMKLTSSSALSFLCLSCP